MITTAAKNKSLTLTDAELKMLEDALVAFQFDQINAWMQQGDKGEAKAQLSDAILHKVMTAQGK